MERRVIYLASPYSSPSSLLRTIRYLQACRAAAKIMEQGHVVFSPIAHSHPVAKYGQLDALDAEMWKRQDEEFLSFASEVWVLTVGGWRDSHGVTHEIEWARANGVPVRFLHPDHREPTDEPEA